MIEWRDIEGYEGSYQVSSDGRVRSLDRTAERYHSRAGRMVTFCLRGRELKFGIHEFGYPYVRLNGKDLRYAHRLVAQAFLKNPLGYNQVDHINGLPTDNRPENLRWSSVSTNMLNRHKTNAASGIFGAFQAERYTKPYFSAITVNGVRTLLGRFDTAEEAGAAHAKARAEVLKNV